MSRRREKTREEGGVAYVVVEPAEELEAPDPSVPALGTVDVAKSPPVAVSVARFEGLGLASDTEEADSAESARDGEMVRSRSRPGDGDDPKDEDASPRRAAVSVSGVSGFPTDASLDLDASLDANDVDVNDRQNETTIDHEGSTMRVDANKLLPDRWELVMLSAHARSCPPDLEGALRRVRRRREAEIAVSGLEKNTRLASAIDRLEPHPDDLEDVDSDVALDHLLALEGGKPLFDAAMGTYDLSAAYLVGARAPGMDPGEYVPELERLQAMPEPLRNADVDLRLGRWRSAVENLLKGGDATQACALAAKKKLFPHALAVAAAWERERSRDAARTEDALSEEPGEPRGVGRGRRVGASGGSSGPKPVSALRATVATAYAGQLGEERRHEDAAVVLLSVGDVRGAMRAYADGSAWRPALALAGRLALPAPERRALASELADALEQFDPAAAAAVAERELGDVDRAASLLCAARKWRDVASVAYANKRGDLVETVVAPAAAEAASGVASAAREAPARAEKYLERLRKLRQRREALEKALGDSQTGADGALGTSAGGAFGRPGTQRDDRTRDDDDAASEMSVASAVSTLASGVSGFSAYTDRTLGAGTVSTDVSGSSLSASTVGGRRAKKPTRAERRGKKAGAGLRAGGPTEERDLAIHLASGGVASELLAVGALEHVGELSELLVVLGHADDAAKLQGAVAAAIAAHEAASAEARRALDALDAAEAKRNTDFKTFEERDGAPASAKNVNAGKTGRYGAACPCAACVAHRSTHCLAAKNAQWKWAALRDAPIPKKKAPTIWDDVAETAMEATRQTR
jgi:elongator complex protein 1